MLIWLLNGCPLESIWEPLAAEIVKRALDRCLLSEHVHVQRYLLKSLGALSSQPQGAEYILFFNNSSLC